MSTPSPAARICAGWGSRGVEVLKPKVVNREGIFACLGGCCGCWLWFLLVCLGVSGIEKGGSSGRGRLIYSFLVAAIVDTNPMLLYLFQYPLYSDGLNVGYGVWDPASVKVDTAMNKVALSGTIVQRHHTGQ